MTCMQYISRTICVSHAGAADRPASLRIDRALERAYVLWRRR
jgi:hypothetical protein